MTKRVLAKATKINPCRFSSWLNFPNVDTAWTNLASKARENPIETPAVGKAAWIRMKRQGRQLHKNPQAQKSGFHQNVRGLENLVQLMTPA